MRRKIEIGNKEKTAINLLTGIITIGIQIVINLWMSPFLVARMGVEANGFTQLANNFVSYAALITIAFNSMAARFMSVSFHSDKRGEAKEYYSSIIGCNLCISAILIPLSAGMIAFLDRVIDIGTMERFDIQVLFAGVFLAFFLNLIFSVMSGVLFVYNEVYITNVVSAVRYILTGVFLLVLFSCFPTKVCYVSLASVGACCVCVPLVWHFAHRAASWARFSFRDIRVPFIKNLFLSGIWNSINQGGNMLMTGFDVLLANWFLGSTEMGILAISKTIPTTITTFVSMVNNSFVPELTEKWAIGDKTEVYKCLKRCMRVSTVLLSAILMTFCAFSKLFYQLWQPGLDPVKLTILSFLAVMAYLPMAGPHVLHNIFTASNKLKVNSVSFVITGMINVGIVWILLKYSSFGVYAIAGVSAGLTIIRNMIVTLPYAAHILELPSLTFFKDWSVSLLCCGVNFVIGYLLNLFLSPGSWLGLIGCVMVAMIFQLASGCIVVLQKEDRAMLWKKMKRVING